MPLRPLHCLAAMSSSLLLLASSARAGGDILVDDFSAPSPAQSTLGVQAAFTTSTLGLYAGVPGQYRDATFFLTTDPNGTGAVATIGGGSASVQDGLGAAGAYYIAYGSWAAGPGTPNAQGAALDLDLRGYHDFQALFPQVAKGLNLNVVFYTSQPLDANNALYYTGSGANLAPAVPGGPVVANLAFNGGGGSDANFNFQHVDGIFFEIEGGGQFPDNAYSLTRLSILAVPEPQSAALMGAGVALLLLRRRRGANQAAAD